MGGNAHICALRSGLDARQTTSDVGAANIRRQCRLIAVIARDDNAMTCRDAARPRGKVTSFTCRRNTRVLVVDAGYRAKYADI